LPQVLNNKSNVIAAAASQLGVSPKELRNLAKKNSALYAHAGKRRVRPGEERRVAKPKVDTAHKKLKIDQLRPLTEERIAIENTFPNTLTFAAIAQAAGMHTSQTECMRRAIRGTCILCDQAPHKYGPKMCHKVPFHKRKDIQSITDARKARLAK
jgi:hypothetical protein